jgi:hypothetical protein
MTRATNDLMDLLHGTLAQALREELERAINAASAEEGPQPIPPALLDKVRQFLKDNDVTAPASNGATNDLSETLAGLDVDVEETARGLPN